MSVLVAALDYALVLIRDFVVETLVLREIFKVSLRCAEGLIHQIPRC